MSNKSTPKISVIHPGIQHSHYLAAELHKRNFLYKYVTSILMDGNLWYIKAIETYLPALMTRIKGRLIYNLPSQKIKLLPTAELKYVYKSKGVKHSADLERLIFDRNKTFQLNLKNSFLDQNDILIGYDTSSWIIAERAKKKGKTFILDQTIGHPIAKDIYNEKIRTKYPEWLKSINSNKADFLLRAEHKEHEFADLIIVPSNFVRSSLIENGVKAQKIVLNPFGTNIDLFKNQHIRNFDEEKLIFLFVGSISPRKGIPDLIKAWKEIFKPNLQLWIVGYGYIPQSVMNDFERFNIQLLGKKNKAELALIYNLAHIFVFPSYFEGLAQVQIEAIACGLPLIATHNSGGEELIEDKKNGYIIEAGNIDQLGKSMQNLINNRTLLKEMSEYSDKKASNLSWHQYGERWKDIIDKLV